MNVWHERADYGGNQFSFVGGRFSPLVQHNLSSVRDKAGLEAGQLM